MRPPRPIVVHYHLFKNAGTSVDRTLRTNFGATWTTIEHEPRLLPGKLGEFLVLNPWVTAVSSHTAMLPTPILSGIEILPILFLRHPLDRVRSIYDFEHQQKIDAPAPNKAKEVDLAGYVDWRLERAASVGDSAIVDFQVYRLAHAGVSGSLLERARQAVDGLPFVGLVEQFEASMARLQDLLAERFPSVNLKVLRANVTPDRAPGLDERLALLRHDLGDERYGLLAAANQGDLELWDYVQSHPRRPQDAT